MEKVSSWVCGEERGKGGEKRKGGEEGKCQ